MKKAFFCSFGHREENERQATGRWLCTAGTAVWRTFGRQEAEKGAKRGEDKRKKDCGDLACFTEIPPEPVRG